MWPIVQIASPRPVAIPKSKSSVGFTSYITVIVNESQMKIAVERGQDFVWRVEQRNKKTDLKFDVGENRENVSERNV